MLLEDAQVSRVLQSQIVLPRLEIVLLVVARVSRVLQFHLLELQEHQREHRHILAIFLEPPHILVVLQRTKMGERITYHRYLRV